MYANSHVAFDIINGSWPKQHGKRERGQRETVLYCNPHLTCSTSVVWFNTAQFTGEFGGVAGMMLKMQGEFITPIEFLAQQYRCPNW